MPFPSNDYGEGAMLEINTVCSCQHKALPRLEIKCGVPPMIEQPATVQFQLRTKSMMGILIQYSFDMKRKRAV